jgi:hypothetical protein
MLAQKIALEINEQGALAVAKGFGVHASGPNNPDVIARRPY